MHIGTGLRRVSGSLASLALACMALHAHRSVRCSCIDVGSHIGSGYGIANRGKLGELEKVPCSSRVQEILRT